MQDSIDETAKCILLRVHLDNLKSLVNDFLYPIYQEKGKSPVSAIRRYICQLVASRNSFSTWLERSVACIELLHNEDDRLESALLVLQVTTIESQFKLNAEKFGVFSELTCSLARNC